MSRILILHGVNYYNAGDHGIVLSMCRAIREAVRGAEIVVTSPFLANISASAEFVRRTREGFEEIYPDEIPDLYQVPVGRKRRGLVLFFAAKILFYLGALTLLPYPLRKRLARTTKFGEAVLAADLVLSKGGGFLLDRGTTYTIPTHLVTIWISLLLRKKTVIYAQTIGPFENRLSRSIAKLVLRKVTLVLARDEYSQIYAKDVLGISSSKLRLTADSAFELAAEVPEKAQNACSSETAVRKRICISLVSPRYSGLRDQEAERSYCAIMAEVAEYIAGKENYEVIFIPHLESGAHSDRVLARRIWKLCSSEAQGKIQVLEPTNPINIIGMMAQCELGVCSRMHSMIFALDASLPFVALSYLPKSDSMLAEAGLADWKLSLPDLARGNVRESSGTIIAKIEEISARLADNRVKARAAQAQFLARSRINMQMVTEILSGHK